MKPIIDPKLFYWLGVADKLNDALVFIFTMLVVAFLLYGFFVALEYMFDGKEPTKRQKRSLLTLFLTTLLVGTIYIFVPTQQTIYRMIIASYVTPNTINDVKGALKDVHNSIVDDVVKVIREIKKENGK